MEKKTVLLDISDIGNPTSGFGQIAKNYAQWYSGMTDDALRFHFLLPPGYAGDFGPLVETTNIRRKYHKFFRKGLPSVDVWHSTTQQQLKRKRGKCGSFVLTIHDLNYLTEKNWIRQLKHRWILQHAINKAAAVTCISQYVGRQIEEQFDLKGKPVRVIYNGVEDISQQPEVKPAFATGRPFFFAIGQIRPKKNFHLLVDMMRYFPGYDLYVCGDDHFAFADVVRQHISQLPTGNAADIASVSPSNAHSRESVSPAVAPVARDGLQETREQSGNAYLTGKITDEERVWLYRHCEAFLFPSVGEGFGLPAIEAMQFGKAVFISSFTCLPEICGDCAFVWESLQPDRMAAELKKGLAGFYEDAQRIERVKRHAKEFSYEKNITAYMNLYRELLSLPQK